MKIEARVVAVEHHVHDDHAAVMLDPWGAGAPFKISLPHRLLGAYQIGRMVEVTLTPKAKPARRVKR